MPFQFDPYQDRFSGSIASLLARRGDIEGNRFATIGNANANAALGSGAAYGRGISEAAGAFANLPLQIAGAKRAALQDEILKGQIQDRNTLRQGQGQVDQMMRGDQLPAGDVGPRQETYLDAAGLFDIPKMTAALGASGVGHLSPELLKGAQQINDSIIEHKSLEAKLAQQQTIAAGDVADGVLKLMDVGMPTDGAMDFASRPALASRVLRPEQYAQVRAQILSLPPDQQRQALMQIRDQAEKLAPTKTLAEGATETGRYGTTIASGAKKEFAPSAASIALTAAGGDAAKANAFLHPDKPDTAAQDDQKYEAIIQKQTLKQPITLEEKAFTTAYEQRKTLGVDKSAAAAAERQARAIQAQTDQQSRAQTFQENEKGRAELTAKVEVPYTKAVQKIETLQDVVHAAAGGNMSAAAVQKLMGVLSVVTVEGVQRINTTELHQFGAQGSLLQRIEGRLGQVIAGQPLPASIQKDLIELGNVLAKGARKNYETGFDQITKRYGLKDERILPPIGAPDEGTARNGAMWAYRDGKWGWWK